MGECNQEQQVPKTKRVPAKCKGAKCSGVQDGWSSAELVRVASRNVRSEAISRRTHKEQEVKDTVSTIQLNCSLTLLGLYIEYSGRGVIAFFFLRNKHSEQKPPHKYPTQMNSETNI